MKLYYLFNLVSLEMLSMRLSLSVFEAIDCLSHRLVRRVEALCDTTDGVTTLDGEDNLRRRVVEYLVYLVATNNLTSIKNSLDPLSFKPALDSVASLSGIVQLNRLRHRREFPF